MLVSARGLSKSYGGVRVLADLDFDLRPGEIRALVGENGAGKSTFIKILSGAVDPDSGTAALEGAALPLGNPLAVRERGVSIVYQELTLVPDLSVAANVFLGRERGTPVLRSAEMTRRAQTMLDELGVSIDARVTVRSQSVAHQQMVEIARALITDAKVLILDEPSATLSDADVSRLFEVLRRLQARGLGIIYVSHRLDEIFQLADSVTVLRDGRHVVTAPTASLTRDALIRHMVGREVSEEFPLRSVTRGETVLAVRGLAAPPRFTDVSFTVRAGEIVGLAGLVGSGRTSAALAVVGVLPYAGVVELRGVPVRFRSPAEAIRRGIAYVTEDRKGSGLFPVMGLHENIAVTHLSAFSRCGVLSTARRDRHVSGAVRDFDIRASGITQPAGTLSGGNQQKALVARYLVEPPAVLIVDEPTRGVDVGARSEIYRVLNRLTAQGLGVLMISSDLPEVLGMSDRIVVMREGRLAGELTRAEATPDRVMALAAAS